MHQTPFIPIRVSAGLTEGRVGILGIRSGIWRNALPALLLFTALAATVAYVATVAQQARRLTDDERFATSADAANHAIAERLMTRLRGLQNLTDMAARGEIGDDVHFDIAANATHQLAREFLAINLIDPDRRIRRVWPRGANEAAIGKVVGQSPEILRLIEEARDARAPRATYLVDLFQGGKGVATYFPIWRDGDFLGYINGVFRVEGVEDLLHAAQPADLAVSLLLVDRHQAAPQAADKPGTRPYAIPLLDKDLIVTVTGAPAEESTIADSRFFLVGMPLSLLSAALLYFSLATRNRATQRQAMLSSILDAAPDAIVTIDAAQRIEVFNPAAERMFGRSAQEMLGQPLDVIMPDEARQQHHAQVASFVSSPEHRRAMGHWRKIRGQRADGTSFPVMVSLSKLRFEGEPLMTAILRDMTDVEIMTEKLVKLAEEKDAAAQRAEEASRAKSMFLATMSHELRTPLNAVIGFSELAAREIHGPLGHPKYLDYMQDIKSSGEHLLGIVNDILDLSKIEAGTFTFSRDIFDLTEMLKHTGETARRLLSDKGLHLVTRVPDDLTAFGDERATRQIALNLLSNALKFTPKGGTVELGAGWEEDKGFVAFWVKDNGKGIPDSIVKKIGQPFIQAGNAYNSSSTGTGLGLAISKALAERMGGSLDIRSSVGDTGPQGTTVTIHLPRHPGAATR
jgi:PAS domain S-box-containing protein